MLKVNWMVVLGTSGIHRAIQGARLGQPWVARSTDKPKKQGTVYVA